MRLRLLFFLICAFTISSCSNDVLVTTDDSIPVTEEFELILDSSKSEMFLNFAKVLSRVTFDNQLVRELIKQEAMKEFDCNNDVLWLNVRDEKIEGKTLRDIFIEYSDANFIEMIEAQIPRLNILFPEILGEYSAESYDISNEELPTILLGKKCNYEFINGICVDTIPFNQIPCYHVLILNENSRIRTNSVTRNSSCPYVFVDSVFDISRYAKTRSQVLSSEMIGQRAIDSYKFFYSTDGGPFSSEFQRDYIYLNITPDNQDGRIIGNVSEYINYIEVLPNLRGLIADQEEDPNLESEKSKTVTREKRQFYDSELDSKFWTKGSYVFHIIVSTSKQNKAIDIPIVAKPADLWDFHYEKKKVEHKTAFRHSKWSATFDPALMTAKPYSIPKDRLISLGKWDITKESLQRFVEVYEYDESEEIEEEKTFDFTDVKEHSIEGKIKGSYSYNKFTVDGEVKYDYKDTQTVKNTYKVTRKVSKTSDNLGWIPIYYNDPIIEKDLGNGIYQTHTYSIGGFTFGLTAF